MTLAHQYIDQLDEKIQGAIFGNVGTIISFRVGLDDAEYLAKQFYPIFNQNDLINLPNYHIYLKLMIDGVTSQPFNAITLPPPQKVRTYEKEIVKLCREKYSKPRKEVEKEITFRSYYSDRTYTPSFLKEKIADKKKQNTLFDTPLF